jgi:GNAT superfamily N-acetyltransferase
MKTLQTKNHLLNIRNVPLKEDIESVRRMAEETGFFRPDEVVIAAELVEERIRRGLASGYQFFLADLDTELVGYTCYGPIACSLLSWDLYWIVTRKEYQGQGIGAALLRLTEEDIRKQGGRNVVIETSSRELYGPTQHFYTKNGYILRAQFTDFYDYGDDKLVYIKTLSS